MMLAARKSRHQLAVALAAVLIGGLGLAVPLLVDDRHSEIALRSATLVAAPRDTFTLSSPVALDILPRVQLERGSVSVAPSASSPLSGSAVLSLLTGGKARLVLDHAQLVLDLAAAPNTAGNGLHEHGLTPVLAALVSMSFSELTIRNSSFRVMRADGTEETLADVDMTVTRQRNGRLKGTGKFVVRNQPVGIDFSIAAKSADGAAPSWPLQIELKSELAQLRATGSISSRDTLQFNASEAEIKITSLRRFARWFGTEWSDGKGLQKFAIKGPLEWSPRGISFPQAAIEIDGNEAAGTLAVRLANHRAAVDGTLDFETLDIGPYVEQAIDGTAGGYFDLSRYLPPQLKLRPVYPILEDIDADLRISAGRITAGGASFGKSAASLSLKNGTMLADLAELEMSGGGRGAGQLSIDASGTTPQYRLKGKLQDVDTGLVAGVLLAYPALAGLGTTTLDLTASGVGRQSILRSLAGRLAVEAPTGASIGVDVRSLIATTKAAAQTGWGSTTRRQTAVENLAAEFSLVEGRMRVDKATARAGDDALSLAGSLDLASGMSDMQIWLVQPETRMPAIGDAGQIATQQSGSGLQIQGALQSPSISHLPLTARGDGARPSYLPASAAPPQTLPGRS
jgi:AsmA protein